MKIRKIIICLLILLLINAIFLVPNVHAISEIKDSADSFLGSAEDSKAKINDNLLKETSSSIYNILLGIGIAASVIVGAFLGIKFIMESPEGKAKVSETLVPYIVGCAVVFGAFTIWKMAINMGNGIENSASTSSSYYENNEKLYCSNCGDELTQTEQHKGRCTNCHKEIKNI